MSRTTFRPPVTHQRSHVAAAPRPRRARVAAGATLLALAFGLAGAVVLQPATAAEVPDSAKKLTIKKQATYTHNVGHVAPPLLTNQFPPAALCLLVTEFCGEQAEETLKPINELVKDNQPEETAPKAEPTQSAQPGDLPVSVIGGARRHESAIKFDLPKVSSDDRIDDFTLFMVQTDPTFHSDSPAFKQFIVGVLQLARQDTSEIPKTAQKGVFDRETFNGVEACPVTKAFKAGENQDGREAATEEDGSLACGFGANGVPIDVDADTTVWAFDLTLAANAWHDGAMPNEGVLFRPIAPPNLAYGDPDFTTSEQITFKGGSSAGTLVDVETSPKPEPIVFPDFSNIPQVQGQQATAPQTITEVLGSAPDPVESDFPAPASDPEPSPAPEIQQAAPAALAGSPETPWIVWMILPLLVGGVYLVTSALTAEVQVAAERAGAMTRLIDARRAAGL